MYGSMWQYQARAEPFASNQQVGTRIPHFEEPFLDGPPDEILGSFDSPLADNAVVIVQLPTATEPILEELPSEVLGSFDRPALYTADAQPTVVESYLDELPADVLGSFDRPYLYTADASPTVVESNLEELPAEQLGWFDRPLLYTAFYLPTSVEPFVEALPDEVLGSFDRPLLYTAELLPATAESLAEDIVADLLGSFDSPLAAPAVVIVQLPTATEPILDELPSEILGSFDRPLLYTADAQPSVVESYLDELLAETLGSFDLPALYTSTFIPWYVPDPFIEELPADLIEAFTSPFAPPAIVVESLAWIAQAEVVEIEPADIPSDTVSPLQEGGGIFSLWSTDEPRVEDVPADLIEAFTSPFAPPVVVVSLAWVTQEEVVEIESAEVRGSFDYPFFVAAEIPTTFPTVSEADVFDDVPVDESFSFVRPTLDTNTLAWLSDSPQPEEGVIDVPDASVVSPLFSLGFFPLVTSIAWCIPAEWIEEEPAEALGSFDIPLTQPIIVPWISATVDVIDVGPPAELMEAWFAPFPPSVAVGTYNDYGVSFLYTAADWMGVYFVLDAVMRATVGTVNTRLWDVTSAAMVAGSQMATMSPTLKHLRSGALVLTNAHEYISQFALSAGSTGDVQAAELIGIPMAL